MRAALNGHTAAVVALAQEYGADVNAADKNGSTALMGAAQNGHTATVVAWFIALMIAAQNGRVVPT